MWKCAFDERVFGKPYAGRQAGNQAVRANTLPYVICWHKGHENAMCSAYSSRTVHFSFLWFWRPVKFHIWLYLCVSRFFFVPRSRVTRCVCVCVCLTGWQISHFDRRKQRHFLITQMTTTSRQRNTLTHSLERTTEDKIKRNEAHWRMNERTKRTCEWTNKGLSQHVHNHKSFYCPSLFREPLSYSAFPHMRLNFNRNL